MNILTLILKEILHRKINFLLSVVGVAVAVALFVSFSTTAPAAKRETGRIQRDLGLNLRIIHKETKMDEFWVRGYSDIPLPEEAVDRFATQTGISYTHLLATLEERVEWDGTTILLTGLATEVTAADKKKPTMSYEIDPGKVFVGYEVAETKGIEDGAEIEILGKTMTVERCLRESGSEDDIRVYAFLDDAQAMLAREGQVSEIKALNCWCQNPDVDELEILKTELLEIVPEGKVIQLRKIAEARDKQRNLVEKYFATAMPFMILVCAAWIGTLAMVNTRERRNEIGVMRALGYGSGRIAGLILGKALFVGAIGAVIGFALGTDLALRFGPTIFKITAKSMQTDYSLLQFALIAAPCFAALSAFIPAMVAVTDDPAVTLREE